MFSSDDNLKTNLENLKPMTENAPSKPPTGHSAV